MDKKFELVPHSAANAEFKNFMMFCKDLNDIGITGFKKMETGTEFYVVQSVEVGGGFNGYAIKRFRLINFNEAEQFIELEDIKGNYHGQVSFGENGNPIFSICKITGMPDDFERVFLDYVSATRYMSHIKYVMDVAEEGYMLAIQQNIKRSGSRGG